MEKQKVMNYYNFYPTIERIITKDIWTQKNLVNILDENLYENLYENLDENININLDSLIKNTTIIIINHYNIINNDPKNSPFYLTMKEFGFNILIYDRFGNLNKNNLFNDIINNKNQNYFIIDNKNNPYINLNSSINIFLNHLAYLPKNYDICYLNNDENNENNENNKNKLKIIEQKTVIYYTIKKYFFSGMKNYIISKKGAEKVINYLKNNIIYSSEELFYNCYENIEDLNFYISKHKLF